MERETGSRREAVRQAAAQWVVRLDDASCSDADRAAFEAWRDESHEHEAAYEREAAEAKAKGLPPPPRVFQQVNGPDRAR